MNINPKDFYQAWLNRNTTSDEVYKYYYKLAWYHVNRFVNSRDYIEEKDDCVQFVVMKCLAHQEKFNLIKGNPYSFFYKQTKLSTLYYFRKLHKRKEAHPMINIDSISVRKTLNKRMLEYFLTTDFLEEQEMEELEKLLKICSNYDFSGKGKNKGMIEKVVRKELKKDSKFLEDFPFLAERIKKLLQDKINKEKERNVKSRKRRKIT